MTLAIPYMHVLPARHSHDEVVIVGNRPALEKLGQAIQRALDGDEAGSGTLFCRDGEGFAVVVVQTTTERIEDEVPLHYADDMAFPEPWPQWLMDACRRAR